MTIYTFPLTGGSYSAEQTRDSLAMFMGSAPSGRPLGAVSCVRDGTPSTTAFITGSGPYTVNIGQHVGVVDAEASASAGPYLYVISVTETKPVTAAHATNPRIDLVSIQISDSSEGDGSSTPGAAVVYTAGTAAATPSAPATPVRSLAVAQIAVPSAASGLAPTVTWVAPARSDATTAYSTAEHTSSKLIPDSAFTVITGWNTTELKNFTYSGGVWTVQVAGRYTVTGQIGWLNIASPAGQRAARLYVNSTNVCENANTPGAAFYCQNTLSWAGFLAVGDTLSVQAFQTQGSTITTNPNAGQCRMNIQRCGPA